MGERLKVLAVTEHPVVSIERWYAQERLQALVLWGALGMRSRD